MAIAPNRRWWALSAMVLCVLVVDLDITILNVAVPTLARELNAGTAQLQWIIDAYIVALAALLIPMGLLGDRIGRRRVLLAGMVVFGVGSVLATFSEGVAPLIIARLLMGAGAAAILPLSMSMLTVVFPPEQRSRAISIWSAAMIAGLPLGPILGGFLLQHFWWGSIFVINIPVIIIAVIAVRRLLPESHEADAAKFSTLPSALLMGGLAALIYGIIAWPHAEVTPVLAVVLGTALLVAFVLTQRRARQPMVDLALFKDRTFSWAAIVATFLTAIFSGVIFVLPQYLEIVRGYSTIQAGLWLLPPLGGLVVASLMSERVPRLLGFRLTVGTGLLIMAAGSALGATTTGTTSQVFLAVWTAAIGLGLGLSLIPAMDAVLGALPPAQAGVGSAIITALRQAGSAIGVAVVGAVLVAVYSRQFEPAGLSATDASAARESITNAADVAARVDNPALLADASAAFISGMTTVLLGCAIAATAAALTCAAFIPGRRAPNAHQEESHHDLHGAA